MNHDPQTPLWPTLDLTVPARAEQLEMVREQVESFLFTELGDRFGGFPMDEVMLAVQEAIANVVRHAYPSDQVPGPLGMHVEVADSQISFTVRDCGTGYDPFCVLGPSHDQPTPGGYGLFLIQSIMSRVEYRSVDKLNELVMIKLLEPVGA